MPNSEIEPKTDLSPAELLASVRASQAIMADGFSRHSWTYDLTYSALAAVMVGGYGLPLPYPFLIEGLALAGLVVLAKLWARKHGIWISGLTPKRARWAAIGIGAAMLPLLFITVWAARLHNAPLVPYLAGGLSFIVALAGARLWRYLLRREVGLQG
ncbi:hypothetical protein ABENE_18530 [Asticcacaulis benevestitus DSM 16100 = ATCC BAA-896]|uniref:Transmembrane protein n=2 Tax=Asticcacaulis TaxID=76890 RepID=V4PLT0_9CAUL|nr:hypothetical protein ABENE_18530 [Asticcacaulis benevestitus DSM 16100 = ATCC BAA-896]